jgi:hypothetical protein
MPTLPTVAFFQPQANFPLISGMNNRILAGPEIPSASLLTAAQLAAAAASWIAASQAQGFSIILKNAVAPLPTNCVGLLMSVDEPNEPKGPGYPMSAAQLKPEFDRLRSLSPTLPICLTLGGDKMLYPTFPSPADAKYYTDLAALGDITFVVDFYPRNRSNKYPLSHPALAVSNLIKLTGKPVHSFQEVNDQQLKPPNPPETNGPPSAADIKAMVDQEIAAGAGGIWWFFTCQAGKYGWTPPGSWLPPIDRNNASMQPNYDMVGSISASLSPVPPPVEDLKPRVERLEAQMAMIHAATAL